MACAGWAAFCVPQVVILLIGTAIVASSGWRELQANGIMTLDDLRRNTTNNGETYCETGSFPDEASCSAEDCCHWNAAIGCCSSVDDGPCPAMQLALGCVMEALPASSGNISACPETAGVDKMSMVQWDGDYRFYYLLEVEDEDRGAGGKPDDERGQAGRRRAAGPERPQHEGGRDRRRQAGQRG
eukprot:SAG22_NODE_4482_length_1256_cov_0.780467_2_plen_185_part_00